MQMTGVVGAAGSTARHRHSLSLYDSMLHSMSFYQVGKRTAANPQRPA
jgi:hypothetical protein